MHSRAPCAPCLTTTYREKSSSVLHYVTDNQVFWFYHPNTKKNIKNHLHK
uniref:Uncharacterized protein n=1 Tax=Rhizophora mucronata TaxID=61149 RepID=A0A2P2NH46_RHIMU